MIMPKIPDRTLTVKRIFNAPLPVIWDAWTPSDQNVRWWAPQGMDVLVITHDFRIGGKWKYAMVMPDGNAFLSDGAKTKFTFQVIHPTPEYRQQQKAMGFYNGWGSALDRLAATLD